MRVVVTGATGNVGTSLLEALKHDPDVESVVGIARRRPVLRVPKVEWVEADVAEDDLLPHFEGADAVVHLAWLIQPSRHEETTRRVNVTGSGRVFRAAAEAGVPKLVYNSSIGAYSEGPKEEPGVDESHPTDGVKTSFYSRHKAATERMLDDLEGSHPKMAIVRMRPGLIFKREAASGIRRLFAGPLLPNLLLRRELIPVVPKMDRLVVQAVHSLDVGEALRLAIKRDVRGAFNVAASPVLDPDRLGEILGAREVPVPPALLRGAAWATWKLRLQPTSPGWLDMGLAVPVMNTARARNELGWEPRHTAGEALLELLEGMREGAGIPTPPLDPGTGGPMRVREILTGVGGRSA